MAGMGGVAYAPCLSGKEKLQLELLIMSISLKQLPKTLSQQHPWKHRCSTKIHLEGCSNQACSHIEQSSLRLGAMKGWISCKVQLSLASSGFESNKFCVGKFREATPMTAEDASLLAT